MCLHQIVFHSFEEGIGHPGIPFGPETGLLVCELCLHACSSWSMSSTVLLRCSFRMMCSCNLFFYCPGVELLSSTEEECCFWRSEVQEVVCYSFSLSCCVFNEQNMRFSAWAEVYIEILIYIFCVCACI